jgi:hypothetical protein
MSLPAIQRVPFKRRERLCCTNCGDVIAIKRDDGTYFRNVANKQHCLLCEELFRHAISIAHYRIEQLIKIGQMQSPIGKPCTDCGQPAICHDIRNYSKPEEGVPICVACNVRRGPGILGEHFATRAPQSRKWVRWSKAPILQDVQ